TGAIGTAAIATGAIMASHSGHNSASDEVGAGLLVAGLVAKLISGAATPAADTRCWDNLPRDLSFASVKLPPGATTATIEVQDAAGRLLPSLTKSITINVPADGKDKVVFVSDRSSTPQTL